MNDNQEDAVERRSPIWFAVFAALHLLCCGLPLLLLAGVSFSFVWPSWPVIGAVLIVLGISGFIWYFKRGCATCPRNEGCRRKGR